MIHKGICTYEVCKLAKEKGFPQDVFGTCEMKSSCYLEDGRYYKDGCIYPVENAYSAPTQSLLQRWLREEKGVIIELKYSDDTESFRPFWSWQIYNTLGRTLEIGEPNTTYELALEDALKYVLENLV